MSLTQTIEQLVAEQKAAARTKYYELLRASAPDPAELLAVMQCAGITTEQLRKDSQLRERVAALAKQVEPLPAMRSRAEQARAAHAEARQQLDEAIARLSIPVNRTAVELQAAERERQVLEQALGELHGLYVFNTNPQLLVPEEAPEIVREIVAAQAEQNRVNGVLLAVRKAEEKLGGARRSLEQREAELEDARQRARQSGQLKTEKERYEQPYHAAIAVAQAEVDAANTALQATRKKSEG